MDTSAAAPYTDQVQMRTIQFDPASILINKGDSDSLITYNTTTSSAPDYLAFRVPYDGYYFISYNYASFHNGTIVSRGSGINDFYMLGTTFAFIGVVLNANPMSFLVKDTTGTPHERPLYENFMGGPTGPVVLQMQRPAPTAILTPSSTQIFSPNRLDNRQQAAGCLFLRQNDYFKLVLGNSMHYWQRITKAQLFKRKLTLSTIKPSVLDIIGFPIRNA
jgi:hypothetical protein